MTDYPKTFDDWWTEIENYSSRAERAIETLGPDAEEWLKTAWALGWIAAERTADGHVAEAKKDVDKAGWPEAALIIEKNTLPESKKIINHNVAQMAAWANLK